jgi:hypothetical protein
MSTNLQFIKSASGNSVSSLSITDCFSDQYDVYNVNLIMDGSTTNKDIRLQYIYSGGTDTSANYVTASLFQGSYTGFIELRYSGQSSHLVTGYNYDGGTGINYTIFNPNDNSSYTFLKSQSSGAYNSSGVKLVGTKAIGVHQVTQANTGINIVPSTSTLENIKVSVYGVK